MDEPIKPESTALATIQSGSVAQVLARLETIQELTRKAMIKDVDYGVIPGTSKPTLLMPGAEKLCVLFRLAASFKTEKRFENTSHDAMHLTVETVCQLVDCNGVFLGEASAMCSTRESKYAYRRSARKCPQCGKETIIKGKAEYGGGWLCWAKKGGCNAKFPDDAPAIIGQTEGRVPNEDLADSYNTVLRIAEKRAYVAAVRKVTGSSGFFDEEIPGEHTEPDSPKEATKPAQATESSPQANGATPNLSVGDAEVLAGWSRSLEDIGDTAQKAGLTEPQLLDQWYAKDFKAIPAGALKEALKKAIGRCIKQRGILFDAKTEKFSQEHIPF